MIDDSLGLDFADLSMEELLSHLCHLIWWNGIRPTFRRMLEADLTLSESVVLRTLQRGSLTVAEVAECMFLSHSAASRAVDRLVHEGYVRREENPDDRRQKQLTLTQAGADLVDEVESIFAQALGPVVATLSVDDQEQFRVIVARMITAYQSVLKDQKLLPTT